MIATIEPASSRAYEAAMRCLLLRLLTLAAVLMLPLAMTGAPAAASPHGHHAASMPMQHCPDPGTRHQSKGAFAECTMACASALPAVDRVDEPSVTYAAPLVAAAPVQELDGLHPDPATPPPRTA